VVFIDASRRGGGRVVRAWTAEARAAATVRGGGWELRRTMAKASPAKGGAHARVTCPRSSRTHSSMAAICASWGGT
jgi:hypothetical protein